MSRKASDPTTPWLLSFMLGMLFATPVFGLQTLEAGAGPDGSAAEKKPVVVWAAVSEPLGVEAGWFLSRGRNSWEIFFPIDQGQGRSVLCYRDLKGSTGWGSLKIHHPRGWFFLHLQWAQGRDRGGKGTDTDYLGERPYHQASFEVTEDTSSLTFDFGSVLALPAYPRWTIKPFLGWQRLREEARMTHGRWEYLYGEKCDDGFSGLDSRYTFEWQALRLGLQGEIQLGRSPGEGPPPLRLKSHLAFFPYVRYRGRGVWNLRGDLQQDPSFLHKAENTGFLGGEGGLALSHRLFSFLELEAGGRLSYLSVESGLDRTYFADGTIVDVSFKGAQTFRAGLYLKLSGRF